MKKQIDVHTGEVMAGANDTILHSDSNNKCLVICAYDTVKKIGGLAHAMFLSGRLDEKKHDPILRDTSGAIDEMVDDMILLGALKENIEVCLVTGENVPHREGDEKYNKTISEAITVLKDKHIKLRKGAMSDAGRKHISFDVSSGKITYE